MDRGTLSFGLEDNLKDNIKVIHLTINRENTFRLRKLFIDINFIKVFNLFYPFIGHTVRQESRRARGESSLITIIILIHNSFIVIFP